MEFIPHDYQKYAIEYIKEHPVSAVLLDMGLGKTSITLTALNDLLFDSFDAHKVLIVAPLRVARNTWPSELTKWSHLSDLMISVVVGTAEERKAALEKQADLYVINRENVQWLIEQSGYSFDFDTVVIDELSSFKNHQSKRFKALMKVRPRVKRIIGLTGTPSSNGLITKPIHRFEMWNIQIFRTRIRGEILPSLQRQRRYMTGTLYSTIIQRI